MRCLHCHRDGLATSETVCPHCGVYLKTLLRDVLPPGTSLRVGAYRLDYALGRGGFGITYRALQVGLNRLVAIKEFFPAKSAVRDDTVGSLLVSKTDRGAYDRALQRFVDEGRILAEIDHPGVVRVIDLFQELGTAYLVMEFLSGHSLRARLEQCPSRPLPEEQVTSIVGQLVEALATVHAASIFHLDVKPDNVIMLPHGRAVLVDFGAARRGFTRKDTQAFTPEYAPLELLADQEVGPGTDLFELGMMAHELLTGALPASALARLAGHSWNPTGLPDIWTPLLEQVLRLPLADRPSSAERWWPTSMRTPADATAGSDAGALVASPSGERHDTKSPANTRHFEAPPGKVATKPPRPVEMPHQPVSNRYGRRKLPRWALGGATAVVLALAGRRYVEIVPRGMASGTATSTTTTGPKVIVTGSTSNAAVITGGGTVSARPTAPPLVSVHPALPSDAVQGFYQAIYDALRTDDQARFGLAYSYLSAGARRRTSYGDLIRHFQPDSDITWQWATPSVAADGKIATVPVLLTEYQGGGQSASKLTWTVTMTSSGWYLDSSSTPLPAAAQPVSAVQSAASDVGRGR